MLPCCTPDSIAATSNVGCGARVLSRDSQPVLDIELPHSPISTDYPGAMWLDDELLPLRLSAPTDLVGCLLPIHYCLLTD